MFINTEPFCCVTGAFIFLHQHFLLSFLSLVFVTKCCVGIWASALWALTSLRNRHRKQIEMYVLSSILRGFLVKLSRSKRLAPKAEIGLLLLPHK